MWVLVRAEVPPGPEESWDAEARRPKDFQLQEMNLRQTREEGEQVLSWEEAQVLSWEEEEVEAGLVWWWL